MVEVEKIRINTLPVKYIESMVLSNMGHKKPET